jgi:hypothetical protein
MAEKIQINLSNDQKKSSDEQFLQAPRNWHCTRRMLRYAARFHRKIQKKKYLIQKKNLNIFF